MGSGEPRDNDFLRRHCLHWHLRGNIYTHAFSKKLYKQFKLTADPAAPVWWSPAALSPVCGWFPCLWAAEEEIYSERQTQTAELPSDEPVPPDNPKQLE